MGGRAKFVEPGPKVVVITPAADVQDGERRVAAERLDRCLVQRPRAERAAEEEQAALFLRYVVARWGAEPVVWMLSLEGDNQAKMVGSWKRVGQGVFASVTHAPVLLYPGSTPWLLDEFRDQTWVDVFGYQAITDFTDDALKLTFAGPFTKAWTSQPTRPLVVFMPPENGVGPR